MCDQSEAEPERRKAGRQLREGYCIKCKTSTPNASIRNAHFCKTCLSGQVEHKFRANLFKAGIRNEKALIALSGGQSSRCLLHLIQSSTNTRGNQFASFAICNVAEYPIDKNGLDIIILSPENKEPSLNPFYVLNSLVSQAKLLECTTVLLGDNQTHIAIKSITHTAKGRGYSLPEDISLSQEICGIKFVRPLRDTSLKEVSLYNYWNNVKSFGYPKKVNEVSSTIDSLTAEFIIGLDSEFPATASTIARTAFKLSKHENIKTCPLCYGFADEVDEFSKLLVRLKSPNISNECCTKECVNCQKYLKIQNYLCYACRNLTRAQGISLPQFAISNIRKNISADQMANAVSEFLLDSDDHEELKQ